MKEKSNFQWAVEWEWTPIIVGAVFSFWTLSLDVWTGGVALVLFGGLAMYKWFMK